MSTLAELAYEGNDLDVALDYAQQGVELCHMWGNSDSIVTSYFPIAMVHQARGDSSAAWAAVREAEKAMRRMDTMPPVRSHLRTVRAHLWLGQGAVPELREWAGNVGLDGLHPLKIGEYLALARIHLALDQPGAALHVLDSVL
jgi:ATP/maltotriose-dependent transcriptional regulator MalT